MGWEFRFFVRDPPPSLVEAARAAVGARGPQAPEAREDAYIIADPTCGMKVRASTADTDVGRPDADIEVKVVRACDGGAEKLKKVHLCAGAVELGGAAIAAGLEPEWEALIGRAWARRSLCRVSKQRWAGPRGEATLVVAAGAAGGSGGDRSSGVWLSVCVEGGGREAVCAEGAALLRRLVPPAAAPGSGGAAAPAVAPLRVVVGGYARWLAEEGWR